MKKVKIVLEGTEKGLLMHSAQNMMKQSPKKNPAKQYDSKEEAEKVAYRNKEGQLVVPARCIKACILNASSWYKVGKNSMKQILAGCSRIEGDLIVLKDKKGKPLVDYIIDEQPVNVQKNKIIRARPLIQDWKLEFNLIYNEDMIGKAIDQVKDIIEEAGQRVGLLDFRPQKYGEYGTFKVVEFKKVG